MAESAGVIRLGPAIEKAISGGPHVSIDDPALVAALTVRAEGDDCGA